MPGIISIPFHIGDFLSGTLHMDTLEKGAYLMLLLSHYQSGEIGIPNDDKQLARICGVSQKTWSRIRPIITEKFDVSGDFLVHNKVIEVLRKVEQKISAQRANALKKHSSVLPWHSHGSAIQNQSQIDKISPLPPLKLNGKKFDVKNLVSDDGWMDARAHAPGWDINFLAEKYNDWVNNGHDVPKYPNKAFPAWCKSYTKGKSP